MSKALAIAAAATTLALAAPAAAMNSLPGMLAPDSGTAQNLPELVQDPMVPGVVPEPGTWAMLIAGFGFVGVAMRRRRALTA